MSLLRSLLVVVPLLAAIARAQSAPAPAKTFIDYIQPVPIRGLAYDPTRDFVRYPDGTVNRWEKLERPGVVLEHGHVVALTLAVLDVPKDQEQGHDRHGSKVIVLPCDGAALDRDLQPAATGSAPRP